MQNVISNPYYGELNAEQKKERLERAVSQARERASTLLRSKSPEERRPFMQDQIQQVDEQLMEKAKELLQMQR